MEAIILSRRDFREYDQIISVYTKEQGKLELLARGVKKIVSKNAAHLEPFSYCIVEMVPGKEIQHLTTAQPLSIFPSIRTNLEKSLAAQIVVATTDRLTHVGQKDARLFALLKSWLIFVEKASILPWLLVDGFLLALLQLLGFAPILDRCVVCAKAYKTMIKEEFSAARKTKPGLYFAGGGLVCPSCREIKEKIGEEIIDCGLKEASDLQLLLKADWRINAGFRLSDAEIQDIHRLVMAFATYHTERKLPDWTVLVRYGIVPNMKLAINNNNA